MDVEQLKRDLGEGVIDGDRLIELIAMQQRQLDRFQRRIEELEKKLSGKPTPRLDESYSLAAEEQLGPDLRGTGLEEARPRCGCHRRDRRAARD